MSGWQQVPVPPICVRLVGFSVPLEGHVLVVSYEGAHLLRLGPPVRVETNDELAEYDIYDADTGVARYRGKSYQIIGLRGGTPLLESPMGERLILDTELKTLSVTRDAKVVFSRPYENFSGDWAVATFSPDGRHIVLGCPYDFDFLVLERDVGG